MMHRRSAASIMAAALSLGDFDRLLADATTPALPTILQPRKPTRFVVRDTSSPYKAAKRRAKSKMGRKTRQSQRASASH